MGIVELKMYIWNELLTATFNILKQSLTNINTLHSSSMKLTIELDTKEDRCIIAEIVELPGVLVNGQNESEAIAKAQVSALRVLADWIEHEEATKHQPATASKCGCHLGYSSRQQGSIGQLDELTTNQVPCGVSAQT